MVADSMFKDFNLLGYYAVSTGKWLQTFRGTAMPSYSRSAVHWNSPSTVSSWTRRDSCPSKRRWLFTSWHDETSHKTAMFKNNRCEKLISVWVQASLFWDVTQRKLLVTDVSKDNLSVPSSRGRAVDVSGKQIGPIFTDQTVQEYCKQPMFRDNLSV